MTDIAFEPIDYDCADVEDPQTVYKYSLVQFYPTPTTGEFFNAGLVVGADAGGELQYWVDDIYWRIHPSAVGLFDESVEDFVRLITRNWNMSLGELSQLAGGLYRISAPMPAIGDSAEHVKQRLWPVFIAQRPAEVCELCTTEKHFDGSNLDAICYKDREAWDRYWILKDGCPLCKLRDTQRNRRWGRIALDRETNILRAIHGRATK